MRKYNHNISERANERLTKREAVVRRQRGVLALVLLVLVSIAILLGTGISAMASSKTNPASLNKYYKSIRVEAGDTLWTIADEYIADLDIEKTEYIAEICSLNQINGDDIQAGDYIVVSYYSQEIK